MCGSMVVHGNLNGGLANGASGQFLLLGYDELVPISPEKAQIGSEKALKRPDLPGWTLVRVSLKI